MGRYITLVWFIVGFTACSSAPKDAAGGAGRTPSSALTLVPPIVKPMGDVTQVIQTGSRPASHSAGAVTLDVMCPVDAPDFVHGGCTVGDGAGARRRGVISGLYPLVSVASGEGHRCVFDEVEKTDVLTAMVFCRASVAPRKPRRF